MTVSELAEDPPDLPIISGEEIGTAAGPFPRACLPIWAQPKTNDDRTLLAASRAAGALRFLPIHFIPTRLGPTGRLLIFDGWRFGTEER